MSRRSESVTFIVPSFRPVPGSPHLVIPPREVTGWRTAYGLVVHRRLGPAGERGFWSVSDPITGAMVCQGESPGRMAAIVALVHTAGGYRGVWGGFSAALQFYRKRFIQNEMLVNDQVREAA